VPTILSPATTPRSVELISNERWCYREDWLISVRVARVISDFRREEGRCGLLGYYAVSSGNLFLTFRDKPNGPSSSPETLVRNYPTRCAITQNNAVPMFLEFSRFESVRKLLNVRRFCTNTGVAENIYRSQHLTWSREAPTV